MAMKKVHSSQPVPYIRTFLYWPNKRKQGVLPRNATIIITRHFILQQMIYVTWKQRCHAKDFFQEDITLLRFLKTQFNLILSDRHAPPSMLYGPVWTTLTFIFGLYYREGKSALAITTQRCQIKNALFLESASGDTCRYLLLCDCQSYHTPTLRY
jgi:hypothetical protein